MRVEKGFEKMDAGFVDDLEFLWEQQKLEILEAFALCRKVILLLHHGRMSWKRGIF
jgi:hypothetical protein